MIIVFVLGIVAIALEEKTKVNKAAVALFMAMSMWTMLMVGAHDILIVRENVLFADFLKQFPNIAALPEVEQIIRFITEHTIIERLGDVSETLFFVMASMLIVNIVDKHGGFQVMTNDIRTTNKRKLLWIICFCTFFFSALLDNLAASIVIIAVLRKLVPEKTDRLKYACMVIIAANAGGSWSPIGDVTTILLWVGKNITAPHQIVHLFLPALFNMLVPLTIAHFWLFKKGATLRKNMEISTEDEYSSHIPARSRKIIFGIGIMSLALVPVFQTVTHLPPFMGVLIGLVILWVYTDLMYSHLKGIPEAKKLRIAQLLPEIDLATIFFFLGILMSVSALNTAGQLGLVSKFLEHHCFLYRFPLLCDRQCCPCCCNNGYVWHPT